MGHKKGKRHYIPVSVQDLASALSSCTRSGRQFNDHLPPLQDPPPLLTSSAFPDLISAIDLGTNSLPVSGIAGSGVSPAASVLVSRLQVKASAPVVSASAFDQIPVSASNMVKASVPIVLSSPFVDGSSPRLKEFGDSVIGNADFRDTVMNSSTFGNPADNVTVNNVHSNLLGPAFNNHPANSLNHNNQVSNPLSKTIPDTMPNVAFAKPIFSSLHADPSPAVITLHPSPVTMKATSIPCDTTAHILTHGKVPPPQDMQTLLF